MKPLGARVEDDGLGNHCRSGHLRKHTQQQQRNELPG